MQTHRHTHIQTDRQRETVEHTPQTSAAVHRPACWNAVVSSSSLCQIVTSSRQLALVFFPLHRPQPASSALSQTYSDDRRRVSCLLHTASAAVHTHTDASCSTAIRIYLYLYLTIMIPVTILHSTLHHVHHNSNVLHIHVLLTKEEHSACNKLH